MAGSDLLGLVRAQAQTRERLTEFAVAAAVAQTQRTDLYDTAAITLMADAIVARVEAAQRQTAALTDAYLARVASQLRGRTTQPVGAVDVTGLRAGVTHAGAYGRLADHYRYLASTGMAETEARAQTIQRARTVATTDIDLAARAQVAKFTNVHQLDYRRVIHPELSTEGTCGLCVAASDRIYHRGDLMPLHDRCRCTVTPIVGSKDPGHTINKADLDRLYQAAGTTARENLHRVRVKTVHHGELGPILTREGHHWRGPAKVAAE